MAEIIKDESGQSSDYKNKENNLKSFYQKKSSKNNILQELAPYASLGIQLVITIVIGAYIGWWLDGRYDTSPWFLIILTFFGAIAGMVNFIKTATKRKK